MLDPRVYRASLLPVLLVLIVVAFSLEDRPGPLRSSLPGDAFDGARAARQLDELERRFPSRRAGSPGDDGLARAVAGELRSVLPQVDVRTRSFGGETLDGDRELLTVTAQAPGSTPRSQVVLVAQRDAAEPGDRADLSATAALIEIARVVGTSRLARSVTFASVSGASGGQAGMRDLVRRLPRPIDAVIEIGDLAGESSDRPPVVGWSGGAGKAASLRLQRTVALAVRREAGITPGFPLARTQLARFALPLSVAGQGVALDAGLPSVRLARGGELPSGPGSETSAARLGEYGQALVRVISALDGPLGAGRPSADLAISKKILPAWAMRLLAAALLLPAALTILDGLMRVRRRGAGLASGLVWVLALALPFAVAALFARAIGLLGAVPDLAPPAPPGAVPLDAAAWIAMGCALATLALVALVVTPWLVRRSRNGPPAGEQSSGLALLLTVLALAVITWLSNPYAALLLVLPLNFWLLLVEREVRLRRGLALALVAASLVPVGLVLAVYAIDLSMSPAEVPWFWMLAVAGGQISVPAALCWSVGAGTAAAAVALALRPAHEDRERQVTVRGPLTYAGPGSLGGTESAMRR